MNGLADLRGRVAQALETALDADPLLDDVVVHADVPDAISPPAYLLVWAEPWLVPRAHCAHVARLDVVCIGPRMDPAPGIETIETLVVTAIPALRAARLPEVEVGPPAPFTIGGIAYLAARLTLSVPLSLGGS